MKAIEVGSGFPLSVLRWAFGVNSIANTLGAIMCDRFVPYCPCCGYDTIGDEHNICPICYWQHDLYQAKHPEDCGGPNLVSLKEAQINLVEVGACYRNCVDIVRKPTEDDKRKPGWKPIT